MFSRDPDSTCCALKLQFILFFNLKMALLNTLNLLHYALRLNWNKSYKDLG